MKFHPLSELFPLMQGREFDELVADIKAHGLREPITTLDGMILDGRNRWRACEAAGAEPRTCEYHGEDPLGWVISLNLHRRHLDESQRAIVAAKIASMPQGRPEETGQLAGISQPAAAEMLNVGERSVRRAREVLDRGSDELITAVESGRVSVSAAAEVTELPKAEQAVLVARGADAIIATAKRLRQAKTAEVVARNDALRREAAALPLPAGQYRTVVIDPPWPMKIIERDVRPSQVGMHYPIMTLDEIKAIELPLAEQATVYLWTTQKFLPDAFDVLKAWDLDYRFTMVWKKPGGPQPYNLPQYNCEFVLVATRGNLLFLSTKAFFTAFDAPRREHSRKPDEFYELIERVSPEPRIDWFSREPRRGFDQHGIEAAKFAERA